MFLIINEVLYFGSNSTGRVYRFKDAGDPTAYNDDGTAINAYWKSKFLSFEKDYLRKLLSRIFFSLKPT